MNGAGKLAKRLSKKRHFSQPLWDGEKSLKGKKFSFGVSKGSETR